MIDTQQSPRASARRHEILEHTATLVASLGYHRVRIADIARRCGTSTGTIHYHFPRREDLLQAALEHSFARAYARQRQTLREIPSSRDRFHALIELQLPTAERIREEWAIWAQIWAEAAVSAEVRAAHRSYYERWYRSVVGLVERGQRSGEFRPGDPRELARLFTSAADGAGIGILTGTSSMSPEQMRALLRGIVADALVPEPTEISAAP